MFLYYTSWIMCMFQYVTPLTLPLQGEKDMVNSPDNSVKPSFYLRRTYIAWFFRCMSWNLRPREQAKIARWSWRSSIGCINYVCQFVLIHVAGFLKYCPILTDSTLPISTCFLPSAWWTEYMLIISYNFIRGLVKKQMWTRNKLQARLLIVLWR